MKKVLVKNKKKERFLEKFKFSENMKVEEK